MVDCNLTSDNLFLLLCLKMNSFRFFKIYDTNRAALEHMYDSSATFSYQIADINPNVTKRRDHNDRKSQDWDPYVVKNRDLSEVRDLGKHHL